MVRTIQNRQGQIIVPFKHEFSFSQQESGHQIYIKAGKMVHKTGTEKFEELGINKMTEKKIAEIFRFYIYQTKISFFLGQNVNGLKILVRQISSIKSWAKEHHYSYLIQDAQTLLEKIAKHLNSQIVKMGLSLEPLGNSVSTSMEIMVGGNE